MGSLVRRVSLLYLLLLSHSCGISHLGALSYLSTMWADSLMLRSCCQVLDREGASHEYASTWMVSEVLGYSALSLYSDDLGCWAQYI